MTIFFDAKLNLFFLAPQKLGISPTVFIKLKIIITRKLRILHFFVYLHPDF